MIFPKILSWHVTQQYNIDSNMSGAFEGMEGPTLPVVSTVTAIDLGIGSVALIGFGTTAWDERVE